MGETLEQGAVRGIPEHTLNTVYIIRFEEKPEFKPMGDVADIKWVSVDEKVDFAFEFQEMVFDKLHSL